MQPSRSRSRQGRLPGMSDKQPIARYRGFEAMERFMDGDPFGAPVFVNPYSPRRPSMQAAFNLGARHALYSRWCILP